MLIYVLRFVTFGFGLVLLYNAYHQLTTYHAPYLQHGQIVVGLLSLTLGVAGVVLAVLPSRHYN